MEKATISTALEEVVLATEDVVTKAPASIKKPSKPISPIGITKASHEESKKRKKMAKASRKINRRK